MTLDDVAISQLFKGCLVKVKKSINKACSMRRTERDIMNFDNYNKPMPTIDIVIPPEYFKVLKIDGGYITLDFFHDHNCIWEQPVIGADSVQLDDACNEYNKRLFRIKEQTERNEAIRYIGDAIAKAIDKRC